MGRYITVSAILHTLVFLAFMIPVWVWTLSEPETIAIVPVNPPPIEEPEDPPTPTPEPTEDLTDARSLVGEEVPTDTPTPTPTPTQKKPTPTPTPTATQKKPTATPTATEVKPTDTPTEKPTPKPTDTPKPTATPEPTDTPEATATPTPNKKATALAKAQELFKEEKEESEKPKPQEPKPVTVGDTKDFKNAGNGLATSVVFTDRGYLGRLGKGLQEKFIPPRVAKTGEPRIAKVYFKILTNGRIENAQIVTKSGHRGVDRAALRAVYGLQKFEPLPAGTPDLEVTCDFRVD